MFVILLDYRAPLDEIDRLMPAHMRFLNECYQSGVFVASGRRRPRTGGVILATGTRAADLEAIMALDPFVAEGAATFEIINFNVSQHADGFTWR